MQYIKTLLITISLFANLTFFLTPALASAQVGELRCGANSAATGDCSTAPNSLSVNEVIARVLNVLSSLVAVVAVIMIIVGGFRYITSGGDSSKAQAARNTVFNAIIGLVIAFFAQIIVRFVLNAVK